jgi:phosphonoacetate hydrolase
VDGFEPDYMRRAMRKGLLPGLARLRRRGFATIAAGAMPSFTNPNNISIVTGAPPSVHGISGNFFLDPDTGSEVMMNDPAFLRAPTILAAFSALGARVAAVTAKDKLRRLLAHGLVNGVAFSAEKADACTLAENGIEDCLDFVGRPLPGVYSAELSLFVLDAGLRLLEERRPDLMYLSLTDCVQHAHAPGSPEADAFYAAIDGRIARLADLGAVVAVTGDHGMNDKARPDGAPEVRYLQDILDAELGPGAARVILPITDPYVAHHGALGSFACVYADGPARTAAARLLASLPGMDMVLDRAAAAAGLDLPADRIGDIVAIADRRTALGTSPARHDLSALGGRRLRSHGGLADAFVPFLLSRPLNARHAAAARSHRVRNFDAFAYALNGVP